MLAATRIAMLPLSHFTFLNRKLHTVADCAALIPVDESGIARTVSTVKAETESALASIIGAESRDFTNTARAADFAAANLATASACVQIVKETHRDKAVRAAAADATVDLEKYALDSFKSNKKLYEAFKSLVKPGETTAGNTAQERYWFGEQMGEFRRKGLDLAPDAADRVTAIYKRLAELDTTFNTNIAEDKTVIVVPLTETDGVPPPVLGAAKKVTRDDGVECVELGMDYPTYFSVMRSCNVASTRAAMSDAFDNRAYPVNLQVLHEVISLRHQIAVELGFASYAHVDLANKMAQSPEVAQKFIADLVPRMALKWITEKKKLIDAGLHESIVLTEAGDIKSCDIMFAMNKYKERFLMVDELAIQEYFPLDSTVKALFDIYQRFFDITFEESAWVEPDCSMMTVRDNRSGDVLGHVVLDLFPREGKFSHACCAGVLPPVRHESGEFAPALTFVLANFPKATPERPALFMHSDVQTFFHEFGHAIHYLMGRAEMATVAGYTCAMDFVELPSQMLEEWMWNRDMLRAASKHYKTGEPLPDALIDKKIESQTAFSGRDGLRQLVFATLALDYFSEAAGSKAVGEFDSTARFAEISNSILKGVQPNPNSHFQCAFGHLLGYGACYYGYMWSKVFALDVFGEISKANGLLDPVQGRKYADALLSCGGARDPNESLRLFLQREPSSDSFFKSMGL